MSDRHNSVRQQIKNLLDVIEHNGESEDPVVKELTYTVQFLADYEANRIDQNVSGFTTRARFLVFVLCPLGFLLLAVASFYGDGKTVGMVENLADATNNDIQRIHRSLYGKQGGPTDLYRVVGEDGVPEFHDGLDDLLALMNKRIDTNAKVAADPAIQYILVNISPEEMSRLNQMQNYLDAVRNTVTLERIDMFSDGSYVYDSEDDGVLDIDDACPTLERGLAPDEDEVNYSAKLRAWNDGCPWQDRDADGIVDVVDECPDVPGANYTDVYLLGGVPQAAYYDAEDSPSVRGQIGVAFYGCPDKDKDDIPDAVDQCPDELAPDPDRDHNGCGDREHDLASRKNTFNLTDVGLGTRADDDKVTAMWFAETTVADVRVEFTLECLALGEGYRPFEPTEGDPPPILAYKDCYPQ